MDSGSTKEMMQTKTPYLPGLLVACMGLSLALTARADDTPAAVDFGQPAATAPVASAKPAKRTKVAAQASRKSTRDPLAVDPTIAVKDTPPKEIDLPGVLKVPGESLSVVDPTRAQKISWANGGSKTVYLSINEPNRIQLPFKNPYIVQMSDVKVDHRPQSNNLYIYWTTPSAQAQPSELFIEPPAGGGPSLGLELVPKNIPAQTVIVQDDTGSTAGKEKKVGANGDYVTHIQDLMADVALGRSPNGFSQVDVQLPPIAMDGLTVTADTRYSSHDSDLWVYTVRNPEAAYALLHEQEFDGPNVLAVSIYPKPRLLPGEKTKVFVLARKREE
jgi:conjugal transfer pilus assembly protein TraK